MADSAITKKALANAIKKLIADMPFKKISISDICDECNMNRKSFYYHFRDKYDLVNWIFDTEFTSTTQSDDNENEIQKLCRYLYINRDFYRRAFRIEGQNSFRSHFYEIIKKYVCTKIQISPTDPARDIKISFYTDGLVCSIERWMLEHDDTSPDDFYHLLCSVNATHTK